MTVMGAGCIGWGIFLDTLGGIGYNFSWGLMEIMRDLGTQLVFGGFIHCFIQYLLAGHRQSHHKVKREVLLENLCELLPKDLI